MEYNTQKRQLIIPEYGRNVQTMIDYCKNIEDKEERNKFTEAIIDVMGNINPHLRDIDDFKHKLWDQLFIMADYDLDVDSPYPKPDREEILKKPKKIEYNGELKHHRYYGKIVQDMIDEVKEWEDGDKKDAAALAIANQMKKSYINWNKDSVDDELIVKDLEKLSDNKLKVNDINQIVQNVTQLPKQFSNKSVKRKKKSKK